MKHRIFFALAVAMIAVFIVGCGSASAQVPERSITAESALDAEPETAAESEAESVPVLEPETAAESEAESVPVLEPETAAESETEPVPVLEPETAAETDAEEMPSRAAVGTPADPADCDYVVNVNSGKFHLPTCDSVRKMNESNKWYYSGDRDTLIADGYDPCKNCDP